ncbi:hypothetical protein M405DRAFT_166184 [Rhizopogon salebrosus TDB-379]|nr:hypothetical protein M405DRAFT_166184 [Rhizopogon salebrosus TDB-379]
MMAPHSTTGSSRQVISVSLLHYISLLYQKYASSSRDVRQSIAKVLPVTHLSHSIFDVSSLPKRRANNEGLTRYYQKVLLGDDTTSTYRRLAPHTCPYPPRRHNFFDFLPFRQPVDGSPSIPL